MGLPITPEDVAALSVEERLKLVDLIWDSIEADSRHDLPQALKDELDRRLADWEKDPDAGSTWEEVKARLTGRLANRP